MYSSVGSPRLSALRSNAMCWGRGIVSGGLGAHVCFGPGEYNTFAAIIA